MHTEDIEVRVEQLGIAINADPEAFKALLQGLASSMQENAIDMLADAGADSQERYAYAEDYNTGKLLAQVAENADSVAEYAAGA